MKLVLTAVLIAMLTGIGINDCIREIPGTSITANAVDPVTSGDYQYFVNDDGTVTVARYVGHGTDITIPSAIDSKKVTVIRQAAFQNCSALTKVVIPNGVISVENDAFMKCTSLKSVVIPESVESLKTPFKFCYSLASISVSTKNKHYVSEDGIVFDKPKKHIICYPPGKTDESYTIPDSVEGIAESAFATCRYLASVSVQDSVTEIGEAAFENCSGITGITVPDSVGTIGSSAFEGCTSLQSVVLPKNISSLSYRLFAGCSSLTVIPLPNSLSSIDGSVFYDCSNLENIIIPESVSSLGTGVFCNCTSLEKIVVPKKITHIPDRTFSGCTALADISFSGNIVSVGSGAFKECTSLKDITLPDSLTYIGNSAFYGCSGLTRIDIPKNVNVIENGAFSYCDSLAEIIIPQGVASINDWVFSHCSKLTKVSIPDSVTSIGDAAFEHCSSLKSIVIPGSVVSVRYGAFYYCIALTDVAISNGVTSIGHNAFSNCIALTSISIPDSVSSIGEYVFAYCLKLTNISVSDGSQYYASENGVLFNKNKTKLIVCPCGKQGKYTIPDGVKTVESYAFAYCTGLTGITVPDSVTSIKKDSLAGCDDLTLYGNSSSYAATYAAENHIPFVATDLTPEPKSVSDLTITLSSVSFTYNGAAKQPTVTVKDGETTLVRDKHYSLEYKDNTNAGTAKVIITGISDYKDSVTKEFTINKKLMDKMTITVAPSSLVYDGTAQKPDVIVKDGTKILVKGTDYLINSYSNNINAGTASVLVIGNGNYGGNVTKDFTITPKPVTDMTIIVAPSSLVYDGTAQKPDVIVKDGTKILVKGTDYLINSYFDNVNVGTASVLVIGKGNYNSSATKKFTITPKSIANTTITINPNPVVYDGTEKQPTVTVKDGTKALVMGTDYKISSYSDNVNAGTAKVTVAGINNYNGKVIKTFTISPKPISSTTITLNPTDFVYDGTQKKPSVTVKNGKTAMKKDIDYTFSYSGNINAGKIKTDGTVEKTGIVTIKGTGNFSGEIEKNFTIEPRSLSKASVRLSPDKYEHDGNAKCPSVTVQLGDVVLTSDKDYKTTYSNNRNIGIATVTVTGKKNYKDVANATFPITEPSLEFKWNADNWQFTNSSQDMGNEPYRQKITSHYLGVLKENLTHSEYKTIFLTEGSREAWLDTANGSCYGMSTAAFLAKYGFISFPNYQPNARNLHDLAAPRTHDLEYPSYKSNVSSLITYYQMLQVKDVIQQYFRDIPNRSNKENIQQIISLLKDNAVVLVGYRWTDGKKTFGHVVLAYGYGEQGNNGYIKVYDPNCSWDYSNLYIYFNKSNYEWSVPNYNISSSGNFPAKFNYICANLDDINNGGYLYSSTINNTPRMFTARIDAPVISDERFVSKMAMYDGVYMNQPSDEDDIVEDYSCILNGNSSGVFGYNLRDADSAYEVSQRNADNIELHMDYENCDLYSYSSSGKSVIFDNKGFVSIEGEAGNYEMSMTFDRDYPTDWFYINVSGTGASDVSLLKETDGYILSGDNLKKIQVCVQNMDTSVSIGFSTDHKKVLIYETDKNTVGLKADKDNNGTYETEIKGVPILENNSYLSSDSIQLGSSVTVIASGKGGEGNLQYAVYCKKTSESKWTLKQDYSTNTTVSIQPKKVADYDICVKVKDSSGTVEKKYFVVSVYDVLKNISTISANQINSGSAVSVKCSAAGGIGNYAYAVYYKQQSQSKWTLKQDFGKNTNVSIKPAKAVDYDICVKVKDSSGTVEKKYFVVSVYDVLKNISTISANQINSGSAVSVKCSAAGGTGNYAYAVYYKQKSQSKWTLKQDFGKNATVSVKPAKAADYDICVKVRDDSGAVAKKYFDVTVR